MYRLNGAKFRKMLDEMHRIEKLCYGEPLQQKPVKKFPSKAWFDLQLKQDPTWKQLRR